jgi:membrane protein required for colicin V production
MDINWLDATVSVLMLLGFIHGIVKGAVQEIAGALAIVVGIVAAGYLTAATAAQTDRLSHPTGAKVFVFVLAFLIVALLIGLLGKLISGLARAANLKLIDRILGGIVGACVVGIAMGIVLTLIERLGVNIDTLRESVIISYLLHAVAYLSVFLPEVAREVNAPDISL